MLKGLGTPYVTEFRIQTRKLNLSQIFKSFLKNQTHYNLIRFNSPKGKSQESFFGRGFKLLCSHLGMNKEEIKRHSFVPEGNGERVCSYSVII